MAKHFHSQRPKVCTACPSFIRAGVGQAAAARDRPAQVSGCCCPQQGSLPFAFARDGYPNFADLWPSWYPFLTGIAAGDGNTDASQQAHQRPEAYQAAAQGAAGPLHQVLDGLPRQYDMELRSRDRNRNPLRAFTAPAPISDSHAQCPPHVPPRPDAAPMARNFALVYVEMAFERADASQRGSVVGAAHPPLRLSQRHWR